MKECLRELERARAADPQNLVVLRKLADERRRRGLELLPALRRPRRYFLTGPANFGHLVADSPVEIVMNGWPVYFTSLRGDVSFL
jgi:hypothetical protein